MNPEDIKNQIEELLSRINNLTSNLNDLNNKFNEFEKEPSLNRYIDPDSKRIIKEISESVTVSDSDINFTDITTGNVSSSKHGFAPKGNGSTTVFLNGNGAYSTPAGTGVTSVTGTSPVASTGGTTPAISVAVATATVSGLVPTPPNNTTTFLRGDATFAVPATSGWNSVATTQVLTSGNSSTWADIDLSAVVGANVALVILSGSISADSSIGTLSVRRNGSAIDYPGNNSSNSQNGTNTIQSASAGNAETGIIVVPCDTSGFIEYKCAGTNPVANLYVLGYIK